MTVDYLEEQGSLVLAAEECDDELFPKIHRFFSYEEKIIRTLVAHGPVLLRGGRGSGKSTLMRQAYLRTRSGGENIFCLYLSLRYLPLLRESGLAYEKFFCELVSDSLQNELKVRGLNEIDFPVVHDGGQLQQALLRLSSSIGKRMVLLFDDAAHLGRENASSEFFDLFRSISSSSVSCKAAIYPGVTNFGKRFDVYNDATVINIARDDRSDDFDTFFEDVMKIRYPSLVSKIVSNLTVKSVAGFLGRTLLGNMRGFIFACNKLKDQDRIGIPQLNRCLLDLCADYYWALLDEVAPKLGRYEPLVAPSRDIAEVLFKHCGAVPSTAIIIHKEWCQQFAKPMEILEYAGFISKREASMALKKGGRGPRYALNLATLLEAMEGSRLTQDLFHSLRDSKKSDVSEINKNSDLLSSIELPPLPDNTDIGILTKPIEALAKSEAYPYGLTPTRLENLRTAGFTSVLSLASATDEELTAVPYIKESSLRRIRAVLAQAIWM